MEGNDDLDVDVFTTGLADVSDSAVFVGNVGIGVLALLNNNCRGAKTFVGFPVLTAVGVDSSD